MKLGEIPSRAQAPGRRHTHASMIVIAMCLGFPLSTTQGAWAQDPGNQTETSQAAGTGEAVDLPTITVEARGTAELARDLPFGVTSIQGADIAERGLVSVEDVLRATPGVSVNSSGGANVSTLYIRGVGALYPMSMDDTSVVVNLDGSPLTSRHISLGNLDVEQIDILKGPQGTLFGGIGEAGAINITSRKPTRTTEGYVGVEMGQDGNRLVEAAAGGALSEQLAGRLAIRYSAFDYPITNMQTGKPVSEPDIVAFRGSLLWDVAAGTSVLMSAERQKASEMGENIVLRPYGSNPKMDVTPGLYDDAEKTLERYSVQANHTLSFGQVTSISSYTDAYNISPVVYDALIQRAHRGDPNATEYWQTQESREKVVTEDLRLGSLPGANVFWVTGFSFLHSDRSYDHPSNTYTKYGNLAAQFRDFTTDRYGVYGETTVPVFTDWKLTAGIRHTWDSKTYDGTYYSGSGVKTGESLSMSDDFTTGRVGLSYALTSGVNLYGTLSRGYNPGGYQDYAIAAGSSSYKAAKINSVELGVKSEFMDRHLTLDAAVFLTKVEDNHLLSYDSTTYVSSAVNADTRSRGAELQAGWRFDNGVTVTGGVTFIDGEIQTSVYGIGDGAVLAGNRMPDIPRWAGTLAVVYTRELPPVLDIPAPTLTARLDYQYVGERPADPQNSFDLDAYHKIDTRVGVSSGNKEVYVFGRNLLDDHYDLYGYYASPISYGAPASGRILGVGFKATF